jgi:hypothetical protein
MRLSLTFLTCSANPAYCCPRGCGAKSAPMGLNYNDVRFLLEWRRDAVGGAVVTFGRQKVFLHPGQRRQLRSDRTSAWLDDYRFGDFADDMFRRAFGFDRVESIDISPFEDATIISDIGAPLPAEIDGQFDLAIDGGTLEHVFNYPVGISNLMRLVSLGGAAYTQNPCGGLAGHGFYQFSPELMYRVFCPDNGFRLQFVRVGLSRTISVEQTVDQPVYDIADPADIGGRIHLQDACPMIVMCLATRIADVPPFRTAPMQSDYAAKWDGSTAPSDLNWKGRLVESIPPLKRFFLRRSEAAKNRKALRRIY